MISTRADPALPLARLRARGELVEVRAADLRFTAREAAAYLNERQRPGLGRATWPPWRRRTEGWVGRPAAGRPVAAGPRRPGRGSSPGFAGDDRFVVDYLADEVLDRQPDDVRRFLLETSVLDRLTGPLCDAVTGRHGRAGGAGGAGAAEPVRRPPRRPPPLVPLPPPVRRRAARAPARRAARRRRRAAPPGRRLVRPGGGSRGGRPARARRGRRRPGRRPGRAARSRRCCASAGRPSSAAGSTSCPPRRGANRPVLAVGLVGGADGEQRVRRHRPPAGRRRAAAGRPGRRPGRRSTRPSSARLPGPVRDLPRRPRAGRAATRRRPWRTPSGAWRAPPPTTTSPSRRPPRWSGSPPGPTGTSPPRTRLPRPPPRACAAPATSSDVLGCTVSLVDIELTQGRLGDAERTSERRSSCAAASRRRRCGAPPTCTSAEPGRLERGDLAGGRRAPAPRRRARRAPPACRSTRTGGGSRWHGCAPPRATRRRARPARRGRAGLRRRLRTARAAGRTPCAPGCSPPPGDVAEALAWAREPRLAADRRADLPARVRARHPGPAPARDSTPSGTPPAARRGDRAARPAAGGGRGGRPDRQRHRDAGAAGARARRRAGDDGPRWSRSSARCGSPSPRATSASSPTRRPAGRAARSRWPGASRTWAVRRLLPPTPRRPAARPPRRPSPGPQTRLLVDPLSSRELDVLRSSPPTSTGRPSPASSACRSPPCAPTPSTSTPSSASTTAGPPYGVRTS